MDKPTDLGQPQPLLQPKSDQGDGYARGQGEDQSIEGVKSMVGNQNEVQKKMEGRDADKGKFKGETRDASQEREDPWKQYSQRGPSEGWQPQPWTPNVAGRR